MSRTKHFITIGTFDGVHVGHRALFTRLEQLAVRHRVKPLVLYFPYPPKTLLAAAPAMTVLSTPPEKKALLRAALAGTRAEALNFYMYREYTPELFFKRVLQEKYHCAGLLAGPDFAFGKNRQGNDAWLQQKCTQLGIPFEMLPFYDGPQGQKISSSLIRKTLAAGDIAAAQTLLGRPYTLEGRVIAGHKLGRKLGFPTANLDTNVYKLMPLGVYAVRVRLGRQVYPGICNIGFRPTVNPIHAVTPLPEVHILDFNRSIYGRRLEVQFVASLRGETKFDGLDALRAQLAADTRAARRLLTGLGPKA